MDHDYNSVEIVDAYENHLNSDHLKNVDDFFDELTKKSKVDIEQNTKTINQLNQKKNEKKENSEQKKTIVALNTLIWLVFGIGLVVAILFFCKAFIPEFLGFDWPLYLSIIVGVSGVVVGGAMMTLSLTIVKRKINEYNNLNQKLEKIIQELTTKANQQMAPLNNLFDWNQPMKLFEKTFPLVQLDEHFNAQRWELWIQKYGLENLQTNESITFVQSGEIKGNPFLFVEKVAQSMFNKIYTGSITIHWTESYTDSDGKRQTRSRSQVLTASLTALAPKYDRNYYIVYGNEAAPNLSFSRLPTSAPLFNEHDLEKYVNSKMKKLTKISEKAVKKGDDFNLLTNKEFEVLYGAWNRDNEVEFRLLFTPVAQRQILKLLKKPKADENGGYFGDYFEFTKKKKVNYVYPRNLKIKNLDINVEDFKTNDYQKTKAIFESFNQKYFDSLLFSLMPLLCIPLYQQFKPAEFTAEENQQQVSSPWEYEVLVQKHQSQLLNHPEAVTRSIFKTEILEHQPQLDQVLVKASAFKGVNRITTFQVHGNDGHYHSVPVHWVEYLPVEKETKIIVKQTENYDLTKFNQQKLTPEWNDYFSQYQMTNNDIIFHRNLISVVGETTIDQQKLDNLLQGGQ